MWEYVDMGNLAERHIFRSELSSSQNIQESTSQVVEHVLTGYALKEVEGDLRLGQPQNCCGESQLPWQQAGAATCACGSGGWQSSHPDCRVLLEGQLLGFCCLSEADLMISLPSVLQPFVVCQETPF